MIPDLTGREFGRLTVLAHDGADRHRIRIWRCSCACGETCRIRTADLTSGKTKSCGCLRSEIASARMLEILSERRARRAA